MDPMGYARSGDIKWRTELSLFQQVDLSTELWTILDRLIVASSPAFHAVPSLGGSFNQSESCRHLIILSFTPIGETIRRIIDPKMKLPSNGQKCCLIPFHMLVLKTYTLIDIDHTIIKYHQFPMTNGKLARMTNRKDRKAQANQHIAKNRQKTSHPRLHRRTCRSCSSCSSIHPECAAESRWILNPCCLQQWPNLYMFINTVHYYTRLLYIFVMCNMVM